MARNVEIAPSYRHDHGLGEAANDKDEDSRQRGIAIHRLLELMCSTGEEAWPTLIRRVAQEQGTSAEDGALQQWAAEAQRLFTVPALQPVLRPTEGEAFNEVPIIYQHQGRTVHGMIDRLLLRDDEAWVVDYKSHRGGQITDLTQLAEPFRQQLDYYAEGVIRLWPQRRIRRFLLFTHHAALHELT